MKNARQNVECSIDKLNEIHQDLTNATETVENPQTKKDIEKELHKIDELKNCMSDIAHKLRDDVHYHGKMH